MKSAEEYTMPQYINENDLDFEVKQVEYKADKVVAKIRKVIKTGNSYYVALPQDFIKKFRIKPGDKVGVISDEIVKVVQMNQL